MFVALVRLYPVRRGRAQLVVMLRAEWKARVGSHCLIKEQSRPVGPNGVNVRLIVIEC